jgi:signal transduction histidine kinase
MNPTGTVRLRRATAGLAVAWALLALLVGVRGQLGASTGPHPPFVYWGAGGRYLVQAVQPSAEAAGVERGDRILEVDGVPVAWWLRSPAEQVAGEANAYLFEKPDGRRVLVRLDPHPTPPTSFFHAMVLGLGIPLVGVVYLGIGAVVWRLRRDRAESWTFLVFCSVVAVELFLSAPVGRTAWTMAGLNAPFIGATCFHLFTTYPIEPTWIVRRRELRAVPYAIAVALALLGVLEPWLGAPPGLFMTFTLFFVVVMSVASFVVLGVERWRVRGDPVAERSDIMVLGAAVSFLPAIAALLAQFFVGTPFPWSTALLGLSFFPAAVGWGIARNQLFDIRLVARSSAAYGAVTLGITGLFAFLVTFADAAAKRFNVNARSTAFSVAFLFFAILLFNPLRSRVQRVVDTFFDRDRAGYRRAVREISEAMVSMLSGKEIVERILVAVTDTMGVESALVLLLDEGDQALRVAASRGDWDEEAASLELPADHPLCKALWMRREDLSRADFDLEENPEVREVCRDVFDALDAELLVPVLYGVDLLGAIAVGRKVSGERLGADDRQLLRTLANQSAIAIENAKAFDEIAQLNETLEARVEERTRELRDTQAQLVQSEKMRSLGQLVAGVAHELNNPIGFVHANLKLLEEQVVKLERAAVDADRERAREAIRKLLSRSREGTERVKKIVQDLRTFSRVDRAELADADLNEEIERTLGLMEPRLKNGIRVEKDFAPLPRVRCFVGQLNQVFMNLLMNACDALDGSGTIRIRTRPMEGGVRLEFADDGPGLQPEVRERIFEPFFTTKPVGKGTGLGLSLSHGIVGRHGGRMGVDSEPGQGACFWIELPAEPPAAALS